MGKPLVHLIVETKEDRYCVCNDKRIADADIGQRKYVSTWKRKPKGKGSFFTFVGLDGSVYTYDRDYASCEQCLKK